MVIKGKHLFIIIIIIFSPSLVLEFRLVVLEIVSSTSYISFSLTKLVTAGYVLLLEIYRLLM